MQNAEELSGMAAVLAQTGAQARPVLNEAALTWKHAQDSNGQTGMHALLAHAEGPGKSSQEWRPSGEADDRHGMKAVLAHKLVPVTCPAPVVRQGTFVGW